MRVVAEVLVAAPAVGADAVRLPQPRHADALAQLQRPAVGRRQRPLPLAGPVAEGHHLADDLVARHHRRAMRLQLALHRVQVGVADAAGVHRDEDLARPRRGHRHDRPAGAASLTPAPAPTGAWPASSTARPHSPSSPSDVVRPQPARSAPSQTRMSRRPNCRQATRPKPADQAAEQNTPRTMVPQGMGCWNRSAPDEK